MSFIAALRARAAALSRRIVFPESGDARTLAAVAEVVRLGICRPVVVLDPAQPHSGDTIIGAGAETIDPSAHSLLPRVREHIIARRRRKGLSSADAEVMARTPLVFADCMVALGEADGCVAGAVCTSADVLRTAIAMVGAAPDVRTVSSAFYMVLKPPGHSEERVLTFTDCAVVPSPTPGQLADIAIAAATDRSRIVGDQPRVALLSYSTQGSASGEAIETLRQALELIRERQPALIVDGELQVDAAIVADVARRKAPESPVAGSANVLVFPDLNSGNIGYKLVERLAGATAIGPILQGLARPCNDLSRGAAADDIINVAAITALQAGGVA